MALPEAKVPSRMAPLAEANDPLDAKLDIFFITSKSDFTK
jgi:hypothetical protein